MWLSEVTYPLATALCCKIRTALGVFKRQKDRFPSFQDQVNIALRHHCKEGNLKWVSLLLWAAADPLAKGPDSPDEDPDPDEDLCALEYAALYKHFDIFKLKKIRISPEHPIAKDLLQNASRADNANFLMELLDQGFKPADQKRSRIIFDPDLYSVFAMVLRLWLVQPRPGQGHRFILFA